MLSGLALLLPTRNNVGEHWGGGGGAAALVAWVLGGAGCVAGRACSLPVRMGGEGGGGGGLLPTRGALVPAVAQKTSTRRKMTEMDSASSFQNVTLPHSLAAVFSASGTC